MGRGLVKSLKKKKKKNKKKKKKMSVIFSLCLLFQEKKIFGALGGVDIDRSLTRGLFTHSP